MVANTCEQLTLVWFSRVVAELGQSKSCRCHHVCLVVLHGVVFGVFFVQCVLSYRCAKVSQLSMFFFVCLPSLDSLDGFLSTNLHKNGLTQQARDLLVGSCDRD